MAGELLDPPKSGPHPKPIESGLSSGEDIEGVLLTCSWRMNHWYSESSGAPTWASITVAWRACENTTLGPNPYFLIQKIWGGVQEFLISKKFVAVSMLLVLELCFENHWSSVAREKLMNGLYTEHEMRGAGGCRTYGPLHPGPLPVHLFYTVS